MEEDDEKVEVDGQLTAESIKSISESMGISNLNDEAINLLIDDGTYRLKQLAQVSDELIMSCLPVLFDIWLLLLIYGPNNYSVSSAML